MWQFSQKGAERIVKRDVLSFIDVVRSDNEFLGAGSNSRQIAINGVLLETTVGPFEGWSGFSSPLLDGIVGLEPAVAYLDHFLTGESVEGLPNNRFELGYCAACLGNDGWVFAATLERSEKFVRWSKLGFDSEHSFPTAKTGPWWRRRGVEPPSDWEWWTLDPLEPELSFTFFRSQYEAAVSAELDRQRSMDGNRSPTRQ